MRAEAGQAGALRPLLHTHVTHCYSVTLLVPTPKAVQSI